jgi:putative MATE family efflux protein
MSSSPDTLSESPRPLPKLTSRPVGRTLFGMAAPMLGGTFAMTAYNLTDTYFVSCLGTNSLAAMSFTFPVVMLIGSIVMGLGTGATATVSHAIGRHDHALVQRLTTHTLILAFIVVIIMAVGGLLTIDPVFRLLGAQESLLPLIHQYMIVWYLGIATVVLPMMAGDILRATGNTVAPSVIMVMGTLLNAILAPIMIFGLFGFPRWGICGAALATIIAQAASGVMILRVLHTRYHMLHFYVPEWKELRASWAEVLHIGIPCCLTNLLLPIAISIITHITARYGETAVAACGTAGRLEMFSFMVPMALGISLVAFVGQNFGANRMDRVIRGRFICNAFAFLWGIFVCIVFVFAARPLATLFSKDEAVISTIVLYLRIVPLGYGMMEIHRYTGFFLNGVRRPYPATLLNIFRIAILILTAFGFSWLFGLKGVFIGRVLADVLSATAGLAFGHVVLKSIERNT